MSVISVKFPSYSSYTHTIENSKDITNENESDDVSGQELLEAAHKVHMVLKKNLQDLGTCLDRVDNALNEVCEIFGIAPNTETPVAPTIPQRTLSPISEEALDFPVRQMRNNLLDLGTHLNDAEHLAGELMNGALLRPQSPVPEILSDSDMSDNEIDLNDLSISETQITQTTRS